MSVAVSAPVLMPKPTSPPNNLEVARHPRELALFMEMDDVPAKPRPVAEIYAEGGTRALDALPTVERGVAGASPSSSTPAASPSSRPCAPARPSISGP